MCLSAGLGGCTCRAWQAIAHAPDPFGGTIGPCGSGNDWVIVRPLSFVEGNICIEDVGLHPSKPSTLLFVYLMSSHCKG